MRSTCLLICSWAACRTSEVLSAAPSSSELIRTIARGFFKSWTIELAKNMALPVFERGRNLNQACSDEVDALARIAFLEDLLPAGKADFLRHFAQHLQLRRRQLAEKLVRFQRHHRASLRQNFWS